MITGAVCMSWQLWAVIPEPPLPVKREREGCQVTDSVGKTVASTTIISYEFFQANNQWGYVTGSTWIRV
jgi:hypothetical protein